VHGGLDLRKGIRERGAGYVLAVRSNYTVTLPSGRRVTVKTAADLVKPAMWQRMRTGSATKGAKDYHGAMIEVTPDDTPEGQDDGYAFLLLRRHRYTGTTLTEPIPVTIPEVLRQFRGIVIPDPAAAEPTAKPGHYGAAATSTALSKHTSISLLDLKLRNIDTRQKDAPSQYALHDSVAKPGNSSIITRSADAINHRRTSDFIPLALACGVRSLFLSRCLRYGELAWLAKV
jgi:hypothetical protein